MIALNVGSHENFGVNPDYRQAVNDERNGTKGSQGDLIRVDVAEDQVFPDKGRRNRESSQPQRSQEKNQGKPVMLITMALVPIEIHMLFQPFELIKANQPDDSRHHDSGKVHDRMRHFEVLVE